MNAGLTAQRQPTPDIGLNECEPLVLDGARTYAALRCTWESESLILALLEHADTQVDGALLRAIANRLERLNASVMSVLGDDNVLTTEHVQALLAGRRGH